MERVCFIILHYKDLQVTDQCVQSILAMEQQRRVEIVIVDNDIKETATKREKLLQQYQSISNIHVIQIKENGGFSYANNIGYSYAREKLGASFILVLNNDIEFTQKDFVEKLERSYEQHMCHVLGPDIVRNSTGEHQNPLDTRVRTKTEAEYTIKMNQFALKWYSVLYPVLFLQKKLEEHKRIHQKRKNADFYSKVQKEIVPFGACLIFTPKFIENEVYAFTPETAFYYEEYILTLRCKRKGYTIVYDPELSVLHESGAVTKKSLGNEWKRIRFMMEQTMEACRIYNACLCERNEKFI